MENTNTVAYISASKGVLQELRNEMVEDEYENILNEGWVCGDVESDIFMTFTDEMKQVYALNHATNFTENYLNKTASEFDDYFDGMYDYIIELKGGFTNEIE